RLRVAARSSPRQGGSSLPAEILPVLGGLLFAMGSLLLAATVVLLRARPDFTTTLLASAHAAACGAVVLSLAVPSMLDDDDARAMGWWPVTRTELTLARLVVLLKPVAGS